MGQDHPWPFWSYIFPITNLVSVVHFASGTKMLHDIPPLGENTRQKMDIWHPWRPPSASRVEGEENTPWWSTQTSQSAACYLCALRRAPSSIFSQYKYGTWPPDQRSLEESNWKLPNFVFPKWQSDQAMPFNILPFPDQTTLSLMKEWEAEQSVVMGLV